MNVEQILQLSKAGFTAEQITALVPMIADTPVVAKKEDSVQKPIEASKTAVLAQEAAKAPTVNQSTVEPSAPTMDDVMSMLRKMQSAMFAGAINGSQLPQVSLPKAEDILATIVAPTKNNKEE